MFTDDEIEYLTTQPIGRLATAQPDGTLQVNPVGFAFNRELGTIDIAGFNMSRSRKFRNIADNGRAAIVVDDVVSTDPWRVRFLEIRGRGETVEGRVSSGEGDLDSEIIRIHPERIISMGLRPGDVDVEPHKLTVDSRAVGDR